MTQFNLREKTAVTLAGIGCITVMEIYALSLGIDGIMFGSVIAIVAGLAGFNLHALTAKFERIGRLR